MFTFIDWLVVAVYLLLIVGVGIWTSRGQVSKRDYFLGGRDMSWWIVGLSIVATETSALTFIGVPAMAFGALAYKDGIFSAIPGSLFFMMIVVGYVTGRIAIAIWVIPYYFKGEVYTTFQLLTRAFGPNARMTAAGISLLAMALGQGVRVLATAIPLMMVMRTYEATANFGLVHGIVLTMLFALVYTVFGGIKAVVLTDMMQYFIFAGGGLLAVLYIPHLLHGPLAAPSGAEGWSAVQEVAAKNLRWFNSGLLSHATIAEKLGHDPSMIELLKAQGASILGEPMNLIMGLIGMPVGIVFALGFDQLNVQRVLGCKSVKDGRKAMLLSATLIAPQFLMFLLIGAGLYAFYSIQGFHFDGIKPWDPTAAEIKVKADYVFPIFIVEQMPIAVKGFMLAAILAAAMSSVSSAMSAMASMFVMDFYKPLTGAVMTEKGELKLSRIAVVVAGILLIGVASLSRGSSFIFTLAFTLAGLTQGALLGPFVYGMIHKRGHPAPVICGMIISVACMLEMNYLIQQKVIVPIAWPWHTLIGMIIALIPIYALRPFFKANADRSMDKAQAGES
ncbi:sodium:solute symporter [soil metagenome]